MTHPVTTVAIRTERLIHRTVTLDDTGDVALNWNVDDPPLSHEEAIGRVQWMQANHAANAPGRLVHLCLAIVHRETGRIIGWCGLDQRDASNARPVLSVAGRALGAVRSNTMNQSPTTESNHFRLHPLAEGVFAAIATNGGSAICNAGIIDLGGQVLVYDTFLTPQAASDLRQAIASLFGPLPCIVINSHYHNDHIWGNQVFAAEAPIIASRRTRALIATEGAEEFKWYSANSAQRLEALRAQYQAADEEQRQELLLWMGEYGGVVEALPHLRVCLPTITFDDRLEIHGARYTAELVAYEGGHTGHDTVLYLPQAGILFMSDLLFVGFHPYLADGDQAQLLKALRAVSPLNANDIVPGHGPVGTSGDLALMIDYVEECLETARTLVEAGHASEAELDQLRVPDKYAHWQLPRFYRTNIRFMCSQLRPASG